MKSCNIFITKTKPTSGVAISTSRFFTQSSPSSPMNSSLLMMARAVHPWLCLLEQVYQWVLPSLEQLFLVNLKCPPWVISTPSLELFPNKLSSLKQRKSICLAIPVLRKLNSTFLDPSPSQEALQCRHQNHHLMTRKNLELELIPSETI